MKSFQPLQRGGGLSSQSSAWRSGGPLFEDGTGIRRTDHLQDLDGTQRAQIIRSRRWPFQLRQHSRGEFPNFGAGGFRQHCPDCRDRLGPDRTPPIVAVTASALKGDRERCLAGGMDDYLSKPIVEADLLRVLNQWLRISTPASTAVSKANNRAPSSAPATSATSPAAASTSSIA